MKMDPKAIPEVEIEKLAKQAAWTRDVSDLLPNTARGYVGHVHNVRFVVVDFDAAAIRGYDGAITRMPVVQRFTPEQAKKVFLIARASVVDALRAAS